jgi:hypothetical protein
VAGLCGATTRRLAKLYRWLAIPQYITRLPGASLFLGGTPQDDPVLLFEPTLCTRKSPHLPLISIFKACTPYLSER